MLSSIHPLGERARNNSFGVTATAHALGALTGGAFVGLFFGGAGDLIVGEAAPAWVAGLVVAMAVLLDLAGVAVPSSRRQVNERWLDVYRGGVYGAGFGFQLGAGVVTIVSTWLVPALLVSAALTASWWQGLVVGAAFGLARGGALLTVAGVDTAEGLRRYHLRLHQSRRLIRWVVLVAASAAALAAGAAG